MSDEIPDRVAVDAAHDRLARRELREGDRAALRWLLAGVWAHWEELPEGARDAARLTITALAEPDTADRRRREVAARRRAQVVERREAEETAVEESENVRQLFGPRGSDEGPVSRE